MDDDQGSGHQYEAPATKTDSPGGFWARIRAALMPGRDASLRASLEGVIDQHDAENGDTAMRPEARSMMINLLEFADLRVDDVMVPRADIIAIEITATVRELLNRFTEAHHSRLPVYRETLDDAAGMIHIKDLLGWIAERSARKAPTASALAVSAAEMRLSVEDSGLVRDVLFVPPSMSTGDMLVKMQSTHIHMAIVVDEYGGTDGLVSIEDLVEEIVGDISDEHDPDEELILPGNDGTYIANARAVIDDLEALLDVDLLPDEQDDEADTLGGLVFQMLRRVPVRGELVRHDSGIEFEILDADPRRINRLKIHTRQRLPRAAEDT